MNGIDTNVLVRYIVQDDPAQSLSATRFIETKCSASNPGFISGIILCELVWVLETAYEYPRAQIAEVLEKILRTRQFSIHEPQLVWQALNCYKKEGADFADHYIGSLNSHFDCEYTATFDKKAARLAHFKLL